MRRLAGLLVASGVLATASACGSSHRAHSGPLYSVAQVRRAFAALGIELHRGASPGPGLVLLVNNARLGPQHIPSPPRVVTVIVATRRQAAERTQSESGHNTQVTRYANIIVFSKPGVFVPARAAVSALRWGTASSGKPARGLIVPGSSIDRIRLDESRTNVEKAFGVGRSRRRGVVSYFGGHLLVDYWFHDGLYKQVEYLETPWSGYRTRSGIHVGSSQRDLRRLYATCTKASCVLLAGPWPDPIGTEFLIRNGRVVAITIGRFG